MGLGEGRAHFNFIDKSDGTSHSALLDGIQTLLVSTSELILGHRSLVIHQ